jgi:type IV pilus assembly protein PilE
MRVPARGRREAGMTLMELLTVMAIVGILAAIAYPSYTQYVMQTNRTDATKTLELAAQSLERCYSQNFTYLNCPVSGNANPNPVVNGSTMPTPDAFYTITFNITDAQDYSLVAAPNAAPQTSDSQCASFSLASSGQQAAQDSNNNDNTRLCWGSN